MCGESSSLAFEDSLIEDHVLETQRLMPLVHISYAIAVSVNGAGLRSVLFVPFPASLYVGFGHKTSA